MKHLCAYVGKKRKIKAGKNSGWTHVRLQSLQGDAQNVLFIQVNLINMNLKQQQSF